MESYIKKPFVSDEGSSSDGESKQELRKRLEMMETKALHNMLKEVDRNTAKKIHPHDRRKVIRY